MNNRKWIKIVFIALNFGVLLTPIIFFSELLYPFTTSKAFYFRSIILINLPFYLYLIFLDKTLRPKIKNPLNVFILLFLFLSLVSAFFGKDFIRSFWGNFERMDSVFMNIHLTLFYFYLLLFYKISVVWFERFLKTVVFLSLITVINGIFGNFGFPILSPDTFLPARVSSTFGNPIFFASFLLFPLGISGFLALKSAGSKIKNFYWLIFILHIYGIWISESRGVILGILLSGFVALILYLLKVLKGKQKLIILGFTGVVICLGVYFIFSQDQNSIGKRSLFSFTDSNAKARLIHWSMALEGFKENPIFGVGPNNYYVISNKFYNTKIWEYDKSWFDKPHNFYLEILATNGSLGFLVYLSLVFYCFFAIYKVYKHRVLSFFESVILGGSLFVYQFQNLFVFDTVSASMMFYFYLGFVNILYSQIGESGEKKEKQTHKLQKNIPNIIFIGLLIVCAYVIYATNLNGYKIAKNLNMAKLFKADNFDITKKLLDSAVDMPFNFYWKDTAYEYSNFAAWYSNRNQTAENLEKSKNMMTDAIKVNEKAVKVHKNDPTVWMKLGNAMFAKSHLENFGYNEQAYNVVFKAHELAPKKHDPKLFMAEIAIEGKKNDVAIAWIQEILTDFPDLQDARWQLANLYYFAGRKVEAEDLALKALEAGYMLDRIKKGDWLLTYWYEKNNVEQALQFLNSQALKSSNDPDFYARLADVYVKLGNYAKAKEFALKVLEFDPDSKKDVETFIKNLPF